MTNLTSSAANAPVEFQFQTNTVRTVAIDGEVWFSASDVCSILGYANSRDALLKHCNQKGVAKCDTLTNGGNQELTYINEPNLYRLVIRSKMPAAQKFEEWVMEEVLPAIRKSGAYIHAPAMRPQLTCQQVEELKQTMNRITCGWMHLSPMHIANHLRVIFSVENWHHIPTEHFETVKAILAQKDDSISQFRTVMLELKDWFEKEVLAGGMPWTPAIKRRLTLQLKRQVILPPKVDWLALAEQVKKPVKGKKGGAR